MAHFIALCDKYPSFRLGVHELSESFKKRGLKYASCVMKFESRVFDSELAGLTEAEADIVKKKIMSLKQNPPTYGEHIILKEKVENRK